MFKKYFISAVCVLSGSVGAAQQALPDPTELEARNAAAGFVSGREQTLGMLYRSCFDELKGASPSLDQVTRQWLERNHLELEASDAWLRFYFTYLKEHDPAQFRAQSAVLKQEQAGVVIKALDVYFKENVPTKASCEVAVQPFSVPLLDFQNLGDAPGYEAFGEFAATFARFRNESAFSIRRSPEQRFDDLREVAAMGPDHAWAAAAEAAGKRGDERARVSILKKMALKDDPLAAQSVGLAYYRGGENLPPNHQLAYQWFYQAWALGDGDGLNGMGVMIKEGKGVPRDPHLAFAVLATAKAVAKSDAAYQRAAGNLEALEPSVPEATRRILACVSLGTLDAKLESLIADPSAQIRRRDLIEPGRPLGALAKDLAPHYSSDGCER